MFYMSLSEMIRMLACRRRPSHGTTRLMSLYLAEYHAYLMSGTSSYYWSQHLPTSFMPAGTKSLRIKRPARICLTRSCPGGEDWLHVEDVQ